MADRRLTGVLLVGGASARFGSPKALAQIGGETLAERAWRVLGEACDERLAVGKEGELELPFPLVDDGTAIRAPLGGIVAGLRAARHEISVFLPVDVPLVRPESLRRLGEATAVAEPGPLPAAFSKAHLPVLEHRLRSGRLRIRDAVAELGLPALSLDRFELANVNEPGDLLTARRREQAVRVALQATGGRDARVLQDWNDTVVHVVDAGAVVRVGTSELRANPLDELAREVDVARYAHARGAPVVRPSSSPHVLDGLVATVWPYLETVGDEPTADELATALRALHRALVGYPRPLPGLEERLGRTARLLRGLELAAADRMLVAEALELRGRLRGTHVLHGGAHGANLLRTREGLRWIDFDSACLGALEWDLVGLPEGALRLFPEADPGRRKVAARVVSGAVVVWCLAQRGRAPEVDEAVEVHLRLLRSGPR